MANKHRQEVVCMRGSPEKKYKQNVKHCIYNYVEEMYKKTSCD